MTTAPIQDIDIYRTAQLTIVHHRNRALLVAMKNIAEFSENEDEAVQ